MVQNWSVGRGGVPLVIGVERRSGRVRSYLSVRDAAFGKAGC
jgi:hypothetical protein